MIDFLRRTCDGAFDTPLENDTHSENLQWVEMGRKPNVRRRKTFGVSTMGRVRGINGVIKLIVHNFGRKSFIHSANFTYAYDVRLRAATRE
jgi:hypothetical protein